MKALKLVSKILVIVFAFLFGVIFVCGGWAKEHINEITAYLGQPSYEIIGNAGDDYEEEDTIYYDSDFTSIAELKAAGEEIAEEVSLEGSALLKNGDVGGKPALPLSEGDTVNFYSMSSYDPIYNGTGDQGRAYMNLEYTETHMLDAFTEAGYWATRYVMDTKQDIGILNGSDEGHKNDGVHTGLMNDCPFSDTVENRSRRDGKRFA